MPSSSTFAILTTLLGASFAVAQTSTPSAPVIMDNTPGQFVMINPKSWHGDTSFVGEISAASSANGGVLMTVNLNGGAAGDIPGGPFKYHIHQYAVPSNGSCDATGAHLDPTNRGETPPCDASQPATCQVGDLSGKHKVCENLPGCTKNFTDAYLSLTPGNAAYIGDKSFVIHFANETRLACANFVTSSNFTATASGPVSTAAATSPSRTFTSTSLTSTVTTTSSTSASSGAANGMQTAAGSLFGLIAMVGFAGL